MSRCRRDRANKTKALEAFAIRGLCPAFTRLDLATSCCARPRPSQPRKRTPIRGGRGVRILFGIADPHESAWIGHTSLDRVLHSLLLFRHPNPWVIRVGTQRRPQQSCPVDRRD